MKYEARNHNGTLLGTFSSKKKAETDAAAYRRATGNAAYVEPILGTCKMKGCKAEATEASGYCFTCAEEVACLLASEGVDPSSAWKAR